MTDAPQKPWRPSSDEPGVGMLDDGKLNVVTPQQHAQAVLERNAQEAADAEDDDDLDEVMAAVDAVNSAG